MSSEPFDVVFTSLMLYFLLYCSLLIKGYFLTLTRENPPSPPSEPSQQYIEPQPVLQSPLWQHELPRPREPPELTYEVPLHPIIHTPRPYNGLIPRAERGAYRPVRRERDITEMSYAERRPIFDRQDAEREKRDREELAQYWSRKAMELPAPEPERPQQTSNETTQVIPVIIVTDVDGSAHEKPVTTGTTHSHVTVDGEEEQSKTADETNTTATTEVDSAGSKELSDDTKTTSHEGTTTVANPEPSQITGTSLPGMTDDSGSEAADTSMMSITSQPIVDEPLTGSAHDSGHENAGTSMMVTVQQPIADEPLSGTTHNSGHEAADMSTMFTTQQPTTDGALAGATKHFDSAAAGNSADLVGEQAAPYVEPANELFQVDNLAAVTKLSGWLSGAISAGQQDNIYNRYYFEELLSILTFWFAWITNSNASIWDIGKLPGEHFEGLKEDLVAIRGIMERYSASIDPGICSNIATVYGQLCGNMEQAYDHLQQLKQDQLVADLETQRRAEAATRQRNEEQERIRRERVHQDEESRQAESKEAAKRKEQERLNKAKEAQKIPDQEQLNKIQTEAEEAERQQKEASKLEDQKRQKKVRFEDEEVRKRQQANLARKQPTQEESGEVEEEASWNDREIAKGQIALEKQQSQQQQPQRNPLQPQQQIQADAQASSGQLQQIADEEDPGMVSDLWAEFGYPRLDPASEVMKSFATTGTFAFGQQPTTFGPAPQPSAEPFAFAQQPPAFGSAPKPTPQTRRDPIQRNRQQNNADRARRNANRPKTTNASQAAPTPPIPAPQNTNASQVTPNSQYAASLLSDRIPRPLRAPEGVAVSASAEEQSVTRSTSIERPLLKSMADVLERTNKAIDEFELLLQDPSLSDEALDFKYRCLHVTPGVLERIGEIHDAYHEFKDFMIVSDGSGAYSWNNGMIHAEDIKPTRLIYRMEKDHDFLRRFVYDMLPHSAGLPKTVQKAMDATNILRSCLYKAGVEKVKPKADDWNTYYGPGKYGKLTGEPRFHPIPPKKYVEPPKARSGSVSSLTSTESVEE